MNSAPSSSPSPTPSSAQASRTGGPSSSTPRERTWAVLGLLCNAAVFGLSWWPFKTLADQNWHPLWTTAILYSLTSALILLVWPQALRGLLAKPQLLVLALSAALTNVGFNWAVTIGDVIRVVLLFYLMPAWSVLVAAFVLGDKPTGAALLRVLLALAGVTIVLKTPDMAWPLPQSLADYLALLGGFCFALTNALLRKWGDTEESTRMLCMFGGGALLTALLGWVGAGQGWFAFPGALNAAGVATAVGLGLALLLGNLALQYGAAHLSAHTTSLIMLSEVLFATVSSAWAGQAELNARTLAGGSLIILAALLSLHWPWGKDKA